MLCIHMSVWLPVAFNVAFNVPEFPKVIHCKGSCVICSKKCVSNLLCLMNQLVVLCSNSSGPHSFWSSRFQGGDHCWRQENTCQTVSMGTS